MAKKNTPVNPWDVTPEELKKEANRITKESSPPADANKPTEAEEKVVIVRVRESYKNRAKAKASRQGISMQEYLEGLIDRDAE